MKILVMGSGVIGVTTAYYLAKGHDVGGVAVLGGGRQAGVASQLPGQAASPPRRGLGAGGRPARGRLWIAASIADAVDGAEFILREVISRSKKSALPQQPKPGPQASPFSRLQSGCCPTMLIHTGRGPRRCHYHASA